MPGLTLMCGENGTTCCDIHRSEKSKQALEFANKKVTRSKYDKPEH